MFVRIVRLLTSDEAAKMIGQDYADQIKELSLRCYEKAHVYAASRGIVLADTKFEFALDESTSPPSVVLVDEVLTPDSSRFWPADKYALGRGQESYDKQYLRGELAVNATVETATDAVQIGLLRQDRRVRRVSRCQRTLFRTQSGDIGRRMRHWLAAPSTRLSHNDGCLS